MKDLEGYKEKIDALRLKDEGSYVFACQAALPLVFTPDLLYHLWNNFKQYQYDFAPSENYKLSHIAVSDLILSDLCHEIGFELYEMGKEIREILLTDLSIVLGEKRRNTIAAFLRDYSLLEYKYAYRKYLKDVYLLTAQSILNPAEMEKTIIERINKSEKDVDKMNYLLLHKNLVPVNFESDLKEISREVNSRGLGSIIIPEENADATGALNIILPEALRKRIQRIAVADQALSKNHENKLLALQLINECRDSININSLDLGNCNLKDDDFILGSEIDQVLRQCTHLKILVLSNERYIWNPEQSKWILKKSVNKGKKNLLHSIPPAMSDLKALSEFACGGEPGTPWGLSNISLLFKLNSLTHLTLNCNQIHSLKSIENLSLLQQLDLSNNKIDKLDGLEKLVKLASLNLTNNLISDIRPLLNFLQGQSSIQLVIKEDQNFFEFNEINLFGNPLKDPPTEIVSKGNKAVLRFFKDFESPEPEPPDTERNIPGWNNVSVRLVRKDTLSNKGYLTFSALFQGREVVRNLSSNLQIIEKLIDDASTNNKWSSQLAATLFELLIPYDFKEELKRNGNINWMLDRNTASYPWELLQDRSADAKPLCIRVGMIRQLVTQNVRINLNVASKNTALVIGDPFLDGYVIQLPGAYAEAEMVSATLNDNDFDPQLILRSSAPEIIKNLFSHNYKIIHLAGHGVFNPDDPDASGMLIGKEVFLTTAEIAQMSTTPELVFVNCCFLGKTDGVAEELYRSRYKLAANIGTQLIENGVKAVVVAGWSVDDAAAMEFTKVFYSNMFEGSNFGEAVQKARKTIYDNYYTVNNTWGAYQCYGDPFYRFNNKKNLDKELKIIYINSEEAEIDLNKLLKKIAQPSYDEDNLIRLNKISAAVDEAEIRNSLITEKEAFIYVELGFIDTAFDKLASLMKVERANFSLRTLEKFYDIRARKCVSDYMRNGSSNKILKEIDKVIEDIQGLLHISESSDRQDLLGRAYSRKAFIVSTLIQKIEAMTSATYFFMKAYQSLNNHNKVYSFSNWMETEGVLVLLGDRKWGDEISYGKNKYRLLSLFDANQELVALKNSVSKENSFAIGNIELCQLVINLSTNVDIKTWDDLLQSYQLAWANASRGNRLAEIEHVILLIDGLSQSKKRDAVKLKKRIEGLKGELEKIR